MSTRKSISWFLIATILLVTFLPAHYHLHHFDDDVFALSSTEHAHVIDLHVLAEEAGQLHHDEDATSIAASPDGIVKKVSPGFSPFILLAIVLLLLPVFSNRINSQLNYSRTDIKQRYPHFTPLLRAPPLH